jgi:hypothetical protein
LPFDNFGAGGAGTLTLGFALGLDFKALRGDGCVRFALAREVFFAMAHEIVGGAGRA